LLGNNFDEGRWDEWETGLSLWGGAEDKSRELQKVRDCNSWWISVAATSKKFL